MIAMRGKIMDSHAFFARTIRRLHHFLDSSSKLSERALSQKKMVGEVRNL
jgi:hypothetical protein